MGTDRKPGSGHSLSFLILGQCVRVECPHSELRRYLKVNFGAMATPTPGIPAALRYRIENGASGSFSLIRDGHEACVGADPGDMLFLLEQDLIVTLQKRRSDLYFLHSAAVEYKGRACLLAAESGSGKSTTAWGLLHHGFSYLSDELSPVDLESMHVHPYAHALCLKQEPAPPYAIPAASLHVGRRIHIPPDALPCATLTLPTPLGAVFLVKHRPELAAPGVRPVSRAEASAHLYVTALNALAHPSRGLDAVVRIAEHVPSFAVDAADLSATCALICSTMVQIAARRTKSENPSGRRSAADRKL
jgi:hypothetical protein